MASLGCLSTSTQWRGSWRTHPWGRAVGRVPPHARHVLQRPRPAARLHGRKASGLVPAAPGSPDGPFVASSGEEPPLSREPGQEDEQRPDGVRGRPGAEALSPPPLRGQRGWAAHVQGAHPSFKHRGPKGTHTLPFQTLPCSQSTAAIL